MRKPEMFNDPGSAGAQKRRNIAARGVSTFTSDDNGATAMMFALAMIPALGFISLGVDYSRSMSFRSEMQAAVDGAVLAGVSATGTLTDENRTTIAKNFFASAMRMRSATLSDTPRFVFNATTGSMTGTVNASLPTTLGRHWAPGFALNVTSTASLASVKVRALDVVMCIDATGSMANTLAAVQTNALNFKSNLDAALTTRGVPAFESMRVRVIYYRDFGGNGYLTIGSGGGGSSVTGTALGDAVALNASNFYALPSDANNYSTFVGATRASGGGDLPESGLECLNEAMQSDWMTVGASLPGGKTVDVVYPVISIYTDAGAHPPNFTPSVQNPSYPAPTIMARNYTSFLQKWNNNSVISQANKMILFYGNPDVDDDRYYHEVSGWQTIKTWPGFSNPGSLTSANTSFINTLATGIATNYRQPTLTN